MLDFHAHVLPCVDDGSGSVKESILMLEALFLQGVTTVCATPHFYAEKTSLHEFIKNRSDAWERLKPKLTKNMPQVMLGAEVHYYEGICHTESISELKLSGTDYLLVEMPYKPWTKREISAILNLNKRPDLTVVLAHVERYQRCVSKDVWHELLQNGVLMQANASFFNSFFVKKKALNMLSERQIHFLGTDAHNMTTRKPRMDEALCNITKRLGSDYINRFSRMEAYLKSEKQDTFNTVGTVADC
jgi:protein-tyrosine phosphatase